ncbi:MAG: DUF481 domain-containing protein [Ghiorsea sp.]|nr:DUF481 domain-containing protein [Ghiorsea sp.]
MLKHNVVGVCCGLMLLVAQIGYADEMPEQTFSGSVNFGSNLSSGNTNTDNFDGNLDLSYLYQDWASTFAFKASQTKEDGILTSDYYEAYLRGSYDIVSHIYTVIQLGYRQDEFSGIYSEKSYVLALGYHAFTDMPDFQLDVELGYGQRVTDKVNKLTVDHDNGMHAALMVEYIFDGDNKVNVKISGEFGNDDDFLLREITWVHQLFHGFTVDFSHEERTITAPATGKVPTDTNTSILLGYSF